MSKVRRDYTYQTKGRYRPCYSDEEFVHGHYSKNGKWVNGYCRMKRKYKETIAERIARGEE